MTLAPHKYIRQGIFVRARIPTMPARKNEATLELLLRALGDRIGFSPPLVIDNDQIADMFDRFGRALEETSMWVEKD